MSKFEQLDTKGTDIPQRIEVYNGGVSTTSLPVWELAAEKARNIDPYTDCIFEVAVPEESRGRGLLGLFLYSDGSFIEQKVLGALTLAQQRAAQREEGDATYLLLGSVFPEDTELRHIRGIAALLTDVSYYSAIEGTPLGTYREVK